MVVSRCHSPKLYLKDVRLRRATVAVAPVHAGLTWRF